MQIQIIYHMIILFMNTHIQLIYILISNSKIYDRELRI